MEVKLDIAKEHEQALNPAVRYGSLDLLKVIAIALVIYIHLSFTAGDIVENQNINTYVGYLIRSINSCSVPLFFFVNGALLFGRPLDIHKHIKKILYLIFLTIAWSILTIIMLMLIKGVLLSPADFVTFIWNTKFGWTNHLWFLGALVVCYILFPILKSTFDNNSYWFRLFFWVALTMTIGAVTLSYLANFLQWILGLNLFTGTKNFFWIFNPFTGSVQWWAVVFFMMGGLLFPKREKLVRRISIRAAILLIFVSALSLFLYALSQTLRTGVQFDIQSATYASPMALIMVISFFVISLHFHPKDHLSSIVQTLGSNTLGIYFIHWILLPFLRPFFKVLPGYGTLPIDIICITALLFSSLGLTLLMKKIPGIKYLVKI
jgi:surface polysaccharide O-acyltransferase-like enzyme